MQNRKRNTHKSYLAFSTCTVVLLSTGQLFRLKKDRELENIIRYLLILTYLKLTFKSMF